MKLSDYVNDDGSILLSTVQTELVENQLIMKILKSVLYREYHGHVPSSGR